MLCIEFAQYVLSDPLNVRCRLLLCITTPGAAFAQRRNRRRKTLKKHISHRLAHRQQFIPRNPVVGLKETRFALIISSVQFCIQLVRVAWAPKSMDCPREQVCVLPYYFPSSSEDPISLLHFSGGASAAAAPMRSSSTWISATLRARLLMASISARASASRSRPR